MAMMRRNAKVATKKAESLQHEKVGVTHQGGGRQRTSPSVAYHATAQKM
eukprot:CAMPEP_0175806798 /NCGR_PEP_ID=MMETSP0107_2-20121207/1382_1 /TAXON_ID=195067 ORGANISM="Goniomonas pacifica, Strain CCMP1869" /NCGR_SAMPLE_ID=MMETSP0107_2 /ASSEMBLY_ACC=CAM_ASM_000203 /LENGTH=48 /DNA_ID= /DNA_START= /DNA_END= /DNA_ORIENTATION=